MLYDASTVLEELLETSDSLTKETDYLTSISKIIDLAGHSCSAEAGFFYTLVDDKFLNLEYSYNEKLNVKKFGSDNNLYQSSIFIPESRSKSLRSAIENCVINNEIINLPEIYSNTKLDNTFFANYDALNDYTSISLLTIPLVNRKGYVTGVKIIEAVSSPDQCLRDYALRAASGSRFTASQDAQERQVGEIVYRFVAQ